MGSGYTFTRNFSKRYLRRFSSKKQLLFDAGVFAESPLLTIQQQQWRACTRFVHPQNRTRNPKISNRVHVSSLPSRSFSTSPSSSSSSYSKTGFLGWYLGMLHSRPIITKAITSSLIYTASDLTSQMITLPASSSFDSVRTLRMAAYGLLILGPSQHLWFNFVSNVLPKQDMLSTLKKLLMGQMIYGPTINSIFFSFNATLQGESGSEIVSRLKRDLPRTLINGLLYWPVCDFVTFKFVPVHLQPLVNSSCSYIWTIYLTYMANLKKVSAD